MSARRRGRTTVHLPAGCCPAEVRVEGVGAKGGPLVVRIFTNRVVVDGFTAKGTTVDGAVLSATPAARDGILRDVLLLAGRDVPLVELALWSKVQRREALLWASSAHLHASEHDDVPVPPEPVHVARFAAAARLEVGPPPGEPCTCSSPAPWVGNDKVRDPLRCGRCGGHLDTVGWYMTLAAMPAQAIHWSPLPADATALACDDSPGEVARRGRPHWLPDQVHLRGDGAFYTFAKTRATCPECCAAPRTSELP